MAAFVTLSFSILLFLFVVVGYAQLSPDFYAQSCPRALSTIRRTIKDVVDSEPRMGASLLRLHFHDCFVNASEENFSAHSFYLGKSFTTDLGSMNGCDASVCLDDNATFTGEKTALPNAHSLRGFDVIDLIKSRVEDLCPRVVSCADILAVAARDSVVALGGPTWPVALGRRDSVTANLTAANTDLPAPSFDLPAIIAAFAKKGLSVTDMVALSGAHTIGQARCTTFRTRIYNETNIDPAYALSLKRECPPSLDDDNLSPLDVCTPEVFDNAYYKNLQNLKGLLHSDQQLYNNGSTDSLVNCYSTDSAAFLDAFVSAMIKMGNLSPLTGTNGIIRSNCSKAS